MEMEYILGGSVLIGSGLAFIDAYFKNKSMKKQKDESNRIVRSLDSAIERSQRNRAFVMLDEKREYNTLLKFDKEYLSHRLEVQA